jgi:hypothetical protein
MKTLTIFVSFRDGKEPCGACAVHRGKYADHTVGSLVTWVIQVSADRQALPLVPSLRDSYRVVGIPQGYHDSFGQELLPGYHGTLLKLNM